MDILSVIISILAIAISVRTEIVSRRRFRAIEKRNLHRPVGRIDSLSVGPDGVHAVGRFYDDLEK